MPLTELAIKNAEPRDKRYKLHDGNGLILRVRPTGGKYWEYKYKVPGPAGKMIERSFALGKWPEVSLKVAREKCREARQLKDPSAEKKKQTRLAMFNASNTFEAVAKEWFDTNRPKWTPRHAKKLWRRIEIHLLPNLGSRPIGEILPLDVLDTIKVLEKENKTETTHRLLQDCNSIFQFGILSQRITYNPARDLNGGLRPHVETNMPSIDERQLPKFITALLEVETTEINRYAVALLMLLFVRTGELRRSRKADFNLGEKLWEISEQDMKMRRPHVVPLSKQAICVLEKLNSLTHDSEYTLPPQQKQKNPFMCENTINNLIHKMGYKGAMVGHGFRALAATILNKNGFDEKIVDIQLAHAPKNKVSAAYNRYKYLEERTRMMQWWADYLENAGLKIY